MRDFLSTSLRTAIIAGATLALAACGGSETVNTAGNELDSNLAFEEPMNDASAMESAANATTDMLPPVDSNVATSTNAVDSGAGDTGGETVESNVAGM